LVYLDADRFMVSWMETAEKDVAVIKANIYSSEGELLEQMDLSETASARSSGFPKIEVLDGKMFLVYTETEPEMTLVTRVFML